MTNTTLESSEIKSSVNEKRFFQTMGHLFATSYSFLGELMQNARRAGATLIDFKFDADNKSLVLADNGSGIEDFAVLIQFCESNWGEDVVLKDKPFGMGLYSLFFACHTVRVRSSGLVIEVTLNDVVESRTLKVLPDAEPVTSGAVIEMQGLNEKLLQNDRLRAECVARAKGFPVPVQFNGEVLPRPDAQENLQGEVSEIGFLSLAGVRGDGAFHSHPCARLYLQGLPIDGGLESYGTQNVIHLDSQSFAAVMPDRSVLFDKKEQSTRIRAKMEQSMRAYLARQQAAIPGEKFVVEYWEDCLKLGVPHLLNSIPCLPARNVYQVIGQSRKSEDNFTFNHAPDSVVTREQVISGQVKIWRNAPDTTSDGIQAAALLRVMEALDIRSVYIHVDHWLADITPDASQMFIERVTPLNEKGCIDAGDMCEAVLVDAVDIEIKSLTDDDFGVTYREDTEWIVLPADLSDQDAEYMEPGDTDTVCYFVQSCTSEPSLVFSDFEDVNDSYTESWHEEARRRWREAMRSIMGLSLSQIAGVAIEQMDCKLGATQAEQLALVRTVVDWNDYNKCFGSPRLKVTDLMDDAFWVKVAEGVNTVGGAVSAEVIREAFFTVAKPAEKLVYDHNGSLCRALGMQIKHVEGALYLEYTFNGEAFKHQVDNMANPWDFAIERVIGQVQLSRPDMVSGWETMDFESKLALAGTVFGLS